MKKIIVGALVGAILIFIWQTLSWAVLDLHHPYYAYTDKQDTLLHTIESSLSKEGQYMLPTVPVGASMAEYEKCVKEKEGKPWAIITYHTNYHVNMGTNMARELAVDLVMLLLFCWMLSKFNAPSFATIFLASVFMGLISFIYGPYTLNIWFQGPGLKLDLLDAIASWGITGIWLGWWMRKK